MAREFALKGGLLDELDDDHLENGDAGGEADASVARASGAFAAARDDDSGSDDAERARRPPPPPDARAPTTFEGDAMDAASFGRDLERLKSDEFVAAALDRGVNLSDYKSQIDRELREVELDSVREYVAQSEQVVELHQRLQRCDEVLARTQETLLGFQADLGGISDEIRDLQNQSLKMGVQLRNRRAAESRVSAFLERLVLPPGAARHLCDGEVGDVYLE